MRNPGYIMLDGGNINLASGSSQTIAGSWDRTVAAVNTGKPIFAYNCKYGDAPLTPVPVFAWNISTTEIVIVGATLHIHVKSDNTCLVIDVAA